MTVRMRLSGVCTREQSTLDCCPCLCARGDLWGECFQEPQKMVQGKPYRIIKKRAAERKETSSPRLVFHYGLLTARIQRSPHLLQNLLQMFWLFLFCCALYILTTVFRAATGPSVVFKATAAVVAMAMQGGTVERVAAEQWEELLSGRGENVHREALIQRNGKRANTNQRADESRTSRGQKNHLCQRLFVQKGRSEK